MVFSVLLFYNSALVFRQLEVINCCASVLGVLSGDCSDSDFYSPTLMLGFKEILTKHTFDKSEAKCNEAGGTLVKWTEGFNMFFESNIKS